MYRIMAWKKYRIMHWHFYFSSARKVTLLNKEVKKGNWDFKACVPIHRFDKQTVGVLGFGRIPRRFIERVKPLGFKTAAYDPFVSAADMAAVGVQKNGSRRNYRRSRLFVDPCALN